IDGLRRITLLVDLARHGAGGSDGSSSAEVRRGGLLAYTAASIVLGLGLLAWTSTLPIAATLDPGLPGTVVAGPGGGLLLWIMFGLLGSLRVLRAQGGGAFFTFHLPFIGAAMVLGGPTAGAWVAFLSTLERRELESQPWYGILANHSVMVIGAVAGGLTTIGLRVLFDEPSLTTGAGFVATFAGILMLAVVTTAMVAGTLLLRDELGPRAFLDLLVGQFGRITALEVALAWVLCLAYLVVGWWAPLAIGAFVLVVWDNDPMPEADALTGLQPATGFERRMEGALGRMRTGLIHGGTMISIDLDGFHDVNNRLGHAVGDEVLKEVGVRLSAQARRAGDLAGRLGGDEFGLFLAGLADMATAMRRADEVCAAITAPISTSAGIASVGASCGVVVLESWGGVPATGTVLRHADQAMFHAKRAGGGTHLFDPDEPAPFDDHPPSSRG
ncbi:MAG: GGDEF domain-containing protein, partial [Chloroflexi bacterium]|nr:GGDEF domain-containing protein [Chloroflexota bacterium]